MSELSDESTAERDAIIAAIHAAFASVVRGEHGISWCECRALDLYEPEDARKAARESEPDSQWSELIASPYWEPFPGIGGFTFINAEGFRYYLPPTMIRFLCEDISEWFDGHLLRHIADFTGAQSLPLWTEAQLRCIARFISFMARHDPDGESSDTPNVWAKALDQRWKAHLPI